MDTQPLQEEKKHHLWIIISFIFVGILLFLIYTSFYNSDLINPISGNVIKGDGDLITIDAELDSPEELNINGKIEKIDLRIESGDFFVEKEKFELDKASIVIDDFEGEVSFNNNNINKFKGKASKVFIEGIPITSSSDMKVYFEEFQYNYIRLNNFYLKSLSYETSGIVKLNNGKAIINLDDENFKIEKFQGDLKIGRNKFELKGQVKESNLGFIDAKMIKEKVEEGGEEEV